jgi:hypothetical protein
MLLNLDGATLIELANFIKDRSVVVLELQYNNLSDIQGLKQIISQHPELEKIYLNYCKIGDAIVQELVNDSTLRERIPSIDFDFSQNEITDAGLIAARGRMSPSTITTICGPNHVRDKKLRDECRAEAVNQYKIQKEKPSAAQTAGNQTNNPVNFFKLSDGEDEAKDPNKANNVTKQTQPTKRSPFSLLIASLKKLISFSTCAIGISYKLITNCKHNLANLLTAFKKIMRFANIVKRKCFRNKRFNFAVR